MRCSSSRFPSIVFALWVFNGLLCANMTRLVVFAQCCPSEVWSMEKRSGWPTLGRDKVTEKGAKRPPADFKCISFSASWASHVRLSRYPSQDLARSRSASLKTKAQRSVEIVQPRNAERKGRQSQHYQRQSWQLQKRDPMVKLLFISIVPCLFVPPAYCFVCFLHYIISFLMFLRCLVLPSFWTSILCDSISSISPWILRVFLQNAGRSLPPVSLSPTRFVPRSFWPRCSPWSKIDPFQYKKKRTSNAYPGKGGNGR